MGVNVEDRIGIRRAEPRTRCRAGGLVIGSVLCSALLAGCGETVRPLGVLVNRAGVTKELVEAAVGSPPAMPVDTQVRNGNVVGDSANDTVKAMPGRKGVEVIDGSSGQSISMPIGEYLTDITLIPHAGAPADDVVVATYPNPSGGGTVRVFRLPETAPKAMWEERAAPGRLGVGPWKFAPALFYLQPEAIVVRDVDGKLLTRLTVPGVSAFRSVHPAALDAGRTVVMASGDGYTPYHMVAILDPQGQLLYHEQAEEHAWRLTVDADGKAFDVDTRSKRWRYKTS